VIAVHHLARIARRARPVSAIAALGMALAVVAAGAGLAGGRLTRTEQVDGYGILYALPGLFWIGVGTATIASGLLWFAADRDRRVAPVVPALWLVLAHTAPATAHAHARFSIVYIHLGFIRLIDATGTGDILIDARFAWPGFFGAFVASLPEMDPAVLDWVMRLWPTMITGASSVLVAALARRSYPNLPLAGPLAALVFVLGSWTGQDYFSPQSVGFLLYLSIVVVLESGPLRARGAWSSVAPILSRFTTSGGDRPEARSTGSFVTMLLLALGAVVSHPLAPFFICAALAMFGIYGRTVAWRLLVMVGVAYAAWVLVAAEPWWSTRIDELVSQIGSFGSNFESSTSERVATSSPAHLFVTKVRTLVGLLTFASTLVLGVVMATDRFRHLRPALPLAPLAGIPVLAAGVQSYGGEIIIRVLLFTLPMASILIARGLLAIPRSLFPAVVSAGAMAILPFFVVARFGNEAFEMVTAVDREAVEVMYEAAGDDTLLVADNSFLPWADLRRESIEHRYVTAEPTVAWVEQLREEAADAGASRVIVIFTPSESAWRQHVESAPHRSLDQVGRWVATQPGAEVLYEHGGAWVVELDW
jgi:hypothetical protein